MLLLILGLVLFLGTHSTASIVPGWRRKAIARIGETRWKLAYSLASAIGLVLIVLGYGAARQGPDLVLLYAAPTWIRHLTLLLMMPVFVLLCAAYLPGRIQRLTRHPMLLAVAIWATAHLLANGTLADLLLFGGFLLWAVADLVSLKVRTSAAVPDARDSRWNDWIAIGLGLGLYAAFVLWLHRWLIGVPVLG